MWTARPDSADRGGGQSTAVPAPAPVWQKPVAVHAGKLLRLARADDFERLFGGLKIGQNPTPLHNRYFILKLNFSMVDPQGDAEVVAASLHRHVNNAIEAFAARYRKVLKAPIDCHPTDALSSLGPSAHRHFNDAL